MFRRFEKVSLELRVAL